MATRPGATVASQADQNAAATFVLWVRVTGGVWWGGQRGISAAMKIGYTDLATSGIANFVYSDPFIVASAEVYGDYLASSGQSAWLDGTGFVGVDLESADRATHHYGWIELSVQDSGAPTAGPLWYDAMVYRWAYETDSNTPIEAGMVPEPAMLGLLLLTTSSLVLHRLGRR